MLALKNITVQIGEAVLVENVSASVGPGRVTAVIGPNGAGKTTLLRVASGELTPSNGSVEMDGRPLEAWSIAQRARRRSVLPQSSALNFPFPVLEVVLMGRSPHVNGVEKTRDWEIAWEALKAVSMEHFAERLYPTLSGGEQQRVHMARTLAQIWEKPNEGHRYLLLDEPTASLDMAYQHALLRLARSISRDETGVLVVLHDLNLAAQYADHIVVLADGRLLAKGTPEEVFTEEIIEEAFDIPVLVTAHPAIPCPLIVARPSESPSNRQSENRADGESRNRARGGG